MADTPQSRPGEIAGWPKLEIRYRTDPNKIADLLPPGITPTDDPTVHIGIYCIPVRGEPEFGVSTKVPATFDGVEGVYSLGMGIDQESAIFISQELNGQPKFPCTILYYRLGDTVEARCTHQGYTFLEYKGTVGGELPLSGEEETHVEWWTKYLRAVGGEEKAYDFPPHVINVSTTSTTTHQEALDGELLLRDSPWDPHATLLPMEELVSASLVTKAVTGRSITKAGTLDPDAFWPYADVIGGSRWPGENGGPKSHG